MFISMLCKSDCRVRQVGDNDLPEANRKQPNVHLLNREKCYDTAYVSAVMLDGTTVQCCVIILLMQRHVFGLLVIILSDC